MAGRAIYILCVIAAMAATSQAQETRPRVLMLLDASQRPAVGPVADALKDHAKVEVPKIAPGDSGTTLERLEEILGDQPWDVIVFNFGLADLHYRDPKTSEIRALSKFAGGIRISSPEQYQTNLTRLAERLRASGAKLIWTNTIPIVRPGQLDDLLDAGSEVEFNRIASEVMVEFDIPIVDLHGYVMEHFTDGKQHPDPLSYHRVAPLDPPIVGEIRQVLFLPSE